MIPVRLRRTVRTTAGAAILVIGISACTLLPVRHEGAVSIRLSPRQPCVLTVLMDAANTNDVAMLRSLLLATARSGEWVDVISVETGSVIGSFTAPGPPATTVAAPPPAPPADSTGFMQARFQRALAQYHANVRHALAALRTHERHDLATWALIVAGRTAANGRRPATGHAGLAAALTVAAIGISNLQATGDGLATRKVIVILGAGSPDAIPPSLHAGLQSMTVVVANLPSGSQSGAAWQADLLRAGASRAIVLAAAADNQLPAVVSQGLDGAIQDQLARLSYGRGQYILPPAADLALKHLLYLLTVRYPAATATISGYTDDITMPGGNLLLSWKRAESVLTWLTAHGVSEHRLQAIGYGDQNPVASNRPVGQPLNRRVVVIVDP